MYGYAGKVLDINLTGKQVSVNDLREDWARDYLGGKGLGFRYLFESVGPHIDPLSPENVLIFMTSPLTGTIISSTGKITVITKSPATGTILDSSMGGMIAAELKYAGYDAVIIRGKADYPVYLKIEDSRVSIEDAADLWGLGVSSTEEELKKKLGQHFRVAAIGPAGEKLVPFACITTERYRQAGRGGAGAVMGSKNLKAIAVSGSGAIKVPNIKKFMARAKEILRNEIMTEDHLVMYTDGTPILVEMCQSVGVLPTGNFQKGVFDHYEKIDTNQVKKFLVSKKGCFSCALACGNYIKINGVTVEGPEYETLALGGSNCKIGDLTAVARFNELCDDLGLDVISTGNILGYCMEMTEKGIHDFGIKFGDVKQYLSLVEDIGHRRGLGDLLAQGVRSLASKYGGREFCMEIKGLEFPGYDPRGSWSLALAYATSDRGACHLRAWSIAQEAFVEGVDPYTIEGKAKMVYDLQVYNSAKWSLGVCDACGLSMERLAEMASMTLGYTIDQKELELIGIRIWNLGRLFNVREGFSRKDDYIPARLFRDKLTGGAADGMIIPRESFEKMLDEYYGLLGWSSDGVPKPETIEKINIEKSLYADYL
ncbi:MAG: aldehyde ferredoxin oxidoreductase family protein [Bacillota bacterium]